MGTSIGCTDSRDTEIGSLSRSTKRCLDGIHGGTDADYDIALDVGRWCGVEVVDSYDFAGIGPGYDYGHSVVVHTKRH